MSTPTPAKATANEKRAGLLFDYAVTMTGFTIEDASTDLGWSHAQTNLAIRALREALAGGSITLVADPAGHQQRWQYRLVGDLADAKPWIANRQADMRSRLATVGYIAQSMVAATDGRSTEGKRARLIAKTIDALEAQLDAIDAS